MLSSSPWIAKRNQDSHSSLRISNQARRKSSALDSNTGHHGLLQTTGMMVKTQEFIISDQKVESMIQKITLKCREHSNQVTSNGISISNNLIELNSTTREKLLFTFT